MRKILHTCTQHLTLTMSDDCVTSIYEYKFANNIRNQSYQLQKSIFQHDDTNFLGLLANPKLLLQITRL